MSRRNIDGDLFPEIGAGGFPRCDVRMEYLTRVNSLLRPDMAVLEFGAGIGKWQWDPVPFRRWLGDFRGRCREVIGADVDPAILDNPQVDRRILLKPGQPIPLPDQSVDLISAFSVFEHVEDVEGCAAELTRILRPGGWICGWTSNRWGFVAVGARMIPLRLHSAVLRLVEPRRNEGDSFVPVYQMNTRRKLGKLFPPTQFDSYIYGADVQPYYHFDVLWVGRLLRWLHWATPPQLKLSHMLFLRKHGQSAAAAEPWQVLPNAASRIGDAIGDKVA
jgi:SAM-dependent methyltransferase